MSNLERYFSKSLAKQNIGLAKILFENVKSEDVIVLIISIEPKHINIKEFSSYLDFIYRIDGQMSSVGYLRYVHNPNVQIEISEIRFGSLQLFIQESLNSLDAEKLIIIWLALKFLPDTISRLMDAPNKMMDFLIKREEYLEKKDRRKFRKHIREVINEEIELSKLSKQQKEKLIDRLDQLYLRNAKKLVPTARFANKFVKAINLLPPKKP